MNRTIPVRRALLAGAATLTALVLSAGCASSHDGMPNMDHGDATPTTAAPKGGGTFNDADTKFAQMMIPHHQQAVEMATLAETQAADPELKKLAAQIKAAQGPEITTMSGWLATWGQPTLTPGGHNMPGMGGMPGLLSDAELDQLRAAKGVDFDRMFARMMIAHHNGAIIMARDCQTKGSNTAAKALAAAIEKAQSTEVEQLQKILDRL